MVIIMYLGGNSLEETFFFFFIYLLFMWDYQNKLKCSKSRCFFWLDKKWQRRFKLWLKRLTIYLIFFLIFIYIDDKLKIFETFLPSQELVFGVTGIYNPPLIWVRTFSDNRVMNNRI